VLVDDDMPVFLARDFEDCVPDVEAPDQPAGESKERTLRTPREGTHRMLVLGWSRKVPALLRELGRYGEHAFEIDIVSATPVVDRESDLARYVSDITGPKVTHIEAGFSTPGVLEGLEPRKYHNIIVLASESLEEKEHADAISVATALTLRGLFAEREHQPSVMVELLDPENRNLFHGGEEEVMVSPTVVSYIVSQVALRRELAWVFWELTRPWGAQILLRSAEAVLKTSGSVRFKEVQRIAATRGEIALGFRRPGDAENGTALNPDPDTEWSLQSGDEVIVLTSTKEPGS
jgi:hypothetical protein